MEGWWRARKLTSHHIQLDWTSRGKAQLEREPTRLEPATRSTTHQLPRRNTSDTFFLPLFLSPLFPAFSPPPSSLPRVYFPFSNQNFVLPYISLSLFLDSPQWRGEKGTMFFHPLFFIRILRRREREKENCPIGREAKTAKLERMHFASLCSEMETIKSGERIQRARRTISRPLFSNNRRSPCSYRAFHLEFSAHSNYAPLYRFIYYDLVPPEVHYSK